MSPETGVKSLYENQESSPAPPPLLGALLRVSWRQVRDRQLEGLQARGFGDLHESYLTVFQWPGPDGARPTELAARTQMSRQAINHLLGQLEALGYLKRVRGPGQATRVRLTEQGHAVMRAMREVVVEVEADWAKRLGAARLEQLRELITELALLPGDFSGATRPESAAD